MSIYPSTEQWVKDSGTFVTKDGLHAILFKAVHTETNLSLKSQTYQGWADKMTEPYTVGARLVAQDFVSSESCGKGLHLSPTPAGAASYSYAKCKILACEVRIEDICPLSYLGSVKAKCKVRSLRVLKEIEYTPKPSYWGAYTNVNYPSVGDHFNEGRSGNAYEVTDIVGNRVHTKRLFDGKTSSVAKRTLRGSYYGVSKPKAPVVADTSLADQVKELL